MKKNWGPEMGQKVTQQYMGSKDPRPVEISGVACTITHPQRLWQDHYVQSFTVANVTKLI